MVILQRNVTLLNDATELGRIAWISRDVKEVLFEYGHFLRANSGTMPPTISTYLLLSTLPERAVFTFPPSKLAPHTSPPHANHHSIASSSPIMHPPSTYPNPNLTDKMTSFIFLPSFPTPISASYSQTISASLLFTRKPQTGNPRPYYQLEARWQQPLVKVCSVHWGLASGL